MKKQFSHQAGTRPSTVIVTLLWCVGCVSSQPLNTSGPANITRTEGDVDEFIPCPFDGQVSTPFWNINGVVYHTTQLPYPFVASYNSSGIIIESITRYLNGTTLQCYVASGSKRDPRPLRSSLGILIVMFNPQSDPPISLGSGSIVIQLTHQHLHFAQDNITLAWSIFDKDTGSDLSRPMFQYSIDISDCNPHNVSTNYNVNDKTIVVSSQGLDSNSFINITLPSQSLSIDERFRIMHGVVTNDIQVPSSGCICVDVPEPERGTFVAIPLSPTSNAPDALCLAVPLITNISDQCHDIQNQCGEHFSTSIYYFQSIMLCGDSSGTKFKMCFTNISTEMNNTRIQFYYSQSPRCTATASRVQSKLYIASYKIIVQATNFSEVINTTTGEICFDIHSRSCSQYISHADISYGVSIFDVTGYLAYKRENVSPESCLQTPIQAHSVCAPFSIVVSTHSPKQSSQSQTHTASTVAKKNCFFDVSDSLTTLTTCNDAYILRFADLFVDDNLVTTNGQTNYFTHCACVQGVAVNPCKCALQNVYSQVYNESSENGTSTILRCNHTYVSDLKLIIEIQQINSTDSPSQEMTIVNCSRGYIIKKDIQCSSLQVSLMLLNDTISNPQCVLLKSNITTGCKSDLKQTSINTTNLTLSIVLPLVLVSTVILVSMIVLILLAVCIIRRKSHHKKYFISLNNNELTEQELKDSKTMEAM